MSKRDYLLIGIADKVEFGASGFKIHNNGTVFRFITNDETALVKIQALYPTVNDDVATKKYVDDNSGVDGVDGTNGVDGTDGTNGVDGAIGANGADGADGVDGTNGVDGTDGVDGGSSPLTAQGDLFSRNLIGDVRLPIGLSNQVLVSTLGGGTNLGWRNVSSLLPINTKGDLLVALTPSTNGKIPLGSNTQILSVDITQPTGLKWIPGPSGSFDRSIINAFRTTSVTWDTSNSIIPFDGNWQVDQDDKGMFISGSGLVFVSAANVGKYDITFTFLFGTHDTNGIATGVLNDSYLEPKLVVSGVESTTPYAVGTKFISKSELPQIDNGSIKRNSRQSYSITYKNVNLALNATVQMKLKATGGFSFNPTVSLGLLMERVE